MWQDIDRARNVDRRMLWFVHCGISAAALALLLHHQWKALEWWSITLQLVGAVVTAYGLFAAYVRSRYGFTVPAYVEHRVKRLRRWFWRTRLGRWIRRLLHKPPFGDAISAGAALATAAAWPPIVGRGYPRLVLDKDLRVEQQLVEVEEYVNRLATRDSQFDTQLQELSIEIDSLKANISAVEANALAHIESQINALTERLDNMQALDLRWAIAGVFIAASGVLLSYWTN